MDKDHLAVLAALDTLIDAKPETIRLAVAAMDGIDQRVAYVHDLGTALRCLAQHVERDADLLAYGHDKDARRLPEGDPVGDVHRGNMYWHEVQCRAMYHYDELIKRAQGYQRRLAEHTDSYPNDGMTKADVENQRAQLHAGCHDTHPPFGQGGCGPV